MPQQNNTPLRVLRLMCSPRGAQSESFRLSQHILDRLRAQASDRGLELIDSDLNDLPHTDHAYAVALASPHEPDRPHPGSTLQRSDALIRQLDEADVLLIATPMHNYSVPSTLKSWIDHIVRIRVTFIGTPQGKRGVLRDRPVYVAIASGGLISGEHARQPDFLRPYLKAALGTVGLQDLHFFSVEGTARAEAALEAARKQANAAVERFFVEKGDGAINRLPAWAVCNRDFAFGYRASTQGQALMRGQSPSAIPQYRIAPWLIRAGWFASDGLGFD
jgi:FMN-dependent NADH-azoreductase